ncbi:hypothetical protein ACP8Y2_23550 [Herpetosiphon llansteffanensis]
MQRRYWLISGILIVLGSVWIGMLAYFSPLSTIVQDEVGHIVISQRAWQRPAFVLDTWGRFGNTLFYMPAAIGGLYVARAFAVLMTALTVGLYLLIARQVGMRYWYLVPLFVYLQPWVSQFAYATTVLPYAVCLGLAAYASLNRRWLWAALAIGCLPLMRHEGLLLLGLWGLYRLAQRDWRSGLLSGLPMLVYYGLCWLVLGNRPWMIFFEPKPTDLYGSGTWWHFGPDLLAGIGWPLVVLVVATAAWSWRKRHVWVVVWPSVVYVLSHVVIYRFGLFASGGYSYFLLPFAFVVAVWATQGLEIVQTALSRWVGPAQIFWPLLAVFVLVALSLPAKLRPIPVDLEAQASLEAQRWIAQNQPQAQPVYATHVWFYYFQKLPLQAPNKLWWSVPKLETMQSGTLVVWDQHYSARMGWPADGFRDQNQWQQLHSIPDRMIIYQKR